MNVSVVSLVLKNDKIIETRVKSCRVDIGLPLDPSDIYQLKIQFHFFAAAVADVQINVYCVHVTCSFSLAD